MNSLDLHLDREIALTYKLFQGKIQETLLRLRSEYLSPIKTAHFSRRLEEVKSHPEVLEQWNNLCPVLGDAIAVHPYGSIQIIQGNLELWDSIAKSRLHDGVIELQGNSYDNLDGYHIMGMKRLNKEKFKEEIFSYLDISAEGRELFFPLRLYPYLTLLAFNGSAKILGTSRLDDNGCLIGIR